MAELAIALPRCPCGGEIKTRRSWPPAVSSFYHVAPVGARSKPAWQWFWVWAAFTTLPLWGRDQNAFVRCAACKASLPRCPCGGEIKTGGRSSRRRETVYHVAPVGARSKRSAVWQPSVHEFTTLPLWGRDQNAVTATSTSASSLPRCPCGGEIKTPLPERWRIGRLYHVAPVGARSKQPIETRLIDNGYSALPLWGRDQNALVVSVCAPIFIAHCPCGGEIKTDAWQRRRSAKL